jgi:hypothetical protein
MAVSEAPPPDVVDVRYAGAVVPLTFERLTSTHEPAVRAFNERIAHASALRLGDVAPTQSSGQLAVSLEHWLAVDKGVVRGGVTLQVQTFVLGSGTTPVANVQLPLTEGVADPEHASVGLWMIRNVLRRYPATFAVGMGGTDRPFPRLLAAMGWDVRLVPFAFYPHRPRAAALSLPSLRSTRLRRCLSWTAAWSGSAWLVARSASVGRTLLHPLLAPLAWEEVPEWGDWATSVWETHGHRYSVAGVRNQRGLAGLYPLDHQRCRAFRMRVGTTTVGWASVLLTSMRDNPYFGNLVVGTVLDTGALPGHEAAVARTTRDIARSLGADISVLNHQHGVWQKAFRSSGYLQGPSNYVLAVSPAIRKAVREAGDPAFARVHVTRGDGDGRIHL